MTTTRDKVRPLLGQGMRDIDIAAHVGVTPSRVWQLRKALGFPPSRAPAPPLLCVQCGAARSRGAYRPGLCRPCRLKARVVKLCGWCGKAVTLDPSRLKQSASGEHFCNRRHRALWVGATRQRGGGGAMRVKLTIVLSGEQRARIVAAAFAARVPLSEYIVGKVLP